MTTIPTGAPAKRRLSASKRIPKPISGFKRWQGKPPSIADMVQQVSPNVPDYKRIRAHIRRQFHAETASRRRHGISQTQARFQAALHAQCSADAANGIYADFELISRISQQTP